MQANSELVNSTFELASIGRQSKQGLKPSVRIERRLGTLFFVSLD